MRTKQYILALLTLAAALPAHAQVGEPRRDLSIGIMAGYTINKMDFMPKIKQTMKSSPMMGIAARFVCEKYFSTICAVQMELQYNNLGWQEDIQDGSGNTYKRDWHFLEVPMLMQMGWGRERRGLKFLFEAGPQVGIYLSGKEHKGGGQWNTDNRPNGVVYQYGKDPDNKFDYGITAGIGLEYSSPVGHFLLQGRYYYGLGDLYDNSKRGDFGRSANQTISVKLTYLLDLMRTKKE
ncbi:MAG: PorT family protein [Bacteroidaceae bacterium]|nr:PorT family protein [Bacteroidaceae bacterium]